MPSPATRRTPRIRLSTPTVAAGVSFAIMLATYLATAAPDLTLWDATEFATAAHTFGIPHPPGTPLWVAMARATTMLFDNAGPARAVTMLSVLTGAGACAVGAAMAARWIGGRGAVVAAVAAGTMYSVWNNATETEVYAASLLLSVCMLFAGERAGRADVTDSERARWRCAIAFAGGLAIPLHLSALVALPAAIVFAWRGPRPTTREMAAYVALVALGLSAVMILPLRAQHAPALNSGNPETFGAMLDVLQRKQYAVPGLWPRRAPLWLQIGNVFQWADWQVAFGAWPEVGPGWKRTPFTLLFVWLGVVGTRALWQHEQRVARAMIVLLTSGLVGVALWLNLEAGPSYGVGVLPAGAGHEARERDYFFALGFWCWGLLAGIGIAATANALSRRVPRLLTVPVLLVGAVPLLVNRHVVDRTVQPQATLPRTFARLLLDAVPQNGVLIVGGDNDTFPLWYLQRVESYRTDVGVVSAPMLGATWYREELRAQRLLPDSVTTSWHGLATTLAAVNDLAESRNRSVRVSVLLSGRERALVDAQSGWALEGLVYSPTPALAPGQTGLEMTALVQARENVPPSSLETLGPGADRAYFWTQQLLRCTTINSTTDSLFTRFCGGR